MIPGPSAPVKKPAIAPKPSSLKSPPLPHKHSHVSPKIPIPMPKPRKLQATQSSPVLSPRPSGHPSKTKAFQSPVHSRANSEDSNVFDFRDSAESTRSELSLSGSLQDFEEESGSDKKMEAFVTSDVSEIQASPTAKRWTPSPKRIPPKPLPRRAPPSPVPPPRRAKSVVDPPFLDRGLKPKLNHSTEDLSICPVEEEVEKDPNISNHSTDTCPLKSPEPFDTCPVDYADALTPPPIPPHKNPSPSRNTDTQLSKPARPPPLSKSASPAPPVRPKPSRKLQTENSDNLSRHPSVEPDDPSPTVPPRNRRSIVSEEKFQAKNSINRDSPPLPKQENFQGHENTTDQGSQSPFVNNNEEIKIPPRKRWSQHSNSNLTALPYHRVQSSINPDDPTSPIGPKSPIGQKSPEVVFYPSGIVGYRSVAPPRPAQGPPKRSAPMPPPPYNSSAKQPKPVPDGLEKRTPPPRPPPMRSALPPKPTTLVQSVSQEQATCNITNVEDSLNINENQSTTDKNDVERALPPKPTTLVQSVSQEQATCNITNVEDSLNINENQSTTDKNDVERKSVVSDDDEYILPDGEYVLPEGPFYENNEVGLVVDPSKSPSPSADSSATKRPIPGRQKRPPPKPKRSPSIGSDISNDGYEDMSRGSLASVALSSISAEVYSVPRSCEHSTHESGRCQCADYAEQSSGEEDVSSDEDEDSYEKFDQEVLADKEEDLDPETRRQRKAFRVAQELRDSERVFVDVLKLINEDFKAAIEDAGKSAGRPVIDKSTLDQILGHLPQLQMFNEDLLADLDSRVNNWSENPRIADIFLKKGPYLKLYNTYIRDYQKLTGTIEDACLKSPLFNTTLKEFEASPRCRNLTLQQHMLKPIQRIPQYKLLLTEYLKQLDEEAEENDYKDTMAALNIVSEVANHVNESMKRGDNLDKLLQLQQSLVGNHEIVRPGRVFIKEGDLLKLSRKVPQTRRFYLLSDILLYTTPFLLTPGQYNYKLHNVLSLAGMKVSKPAQEDYKNEFSIISVQRSFTLAASSPEERDSWISTLNKAVTEYASKRSSFAVLHPQYAQLLSESDTLSLGRKAPAWIPDARVTMCMMCTCEFTITWRRHHCRACGKVVCGNCSSNKVPLYYLSNKIARICDQCYSSLKGDKPNDETDDSGKGRRRKRSSKPIIRPSALKQVSANERDTSMSGYLMLRRKKDWKRQWYVLKEKVLYRYKASEDVAALESMPLLGYEVNLLNEPFEGVEPGLIIQLCHLPKVLIQLRAENKTAAEKWATFMGEATHL